MDLGDSENIYRNPRLQHPIIILKNFAQPCSFSVKFWCCNLGRSCTLLEFLGSLEFCYVFGFPHIMGVLTLGEVKTRSEGDPSGCSLGFVVTRAKVAFKGKYNFDDEVIHLQKKLVKLRCYFWQQMELTNQSSFWITISNSQTSIEKKIFELTAYYGIDRYPG